MVKLEKVNNMTKPLTSKSSGMTDPEKLPSSFVEAKLVQLGGDKPCR